MKHTIPIFFLIAALPLLRGEEPTAVESNGIVRFEAESTKSNPGNWVKKTDLPDYSGDGYLEFTGNTPTNGPADSPLTYTFRISKAGLYFLHLRCARETIGDRDDLANDGYVRLEGDFGPGPNPGETHGDDAPLEMLNTDTKFFGGKDREFVWASGNRLDPGGHKNKRVAVYFLKSGETYTLTLSGRSQLFKVDEILFRHEDVDAEVAEAEKK